MLGVKWHGGPFATNFKHVSLELCENEFTLEIFAGSERSFNVVIKF